MRCNASELRTASSWATARMAVINVAARVPLGMTAAAPAWRGEEEQVVGVLTGDQEHLHGRAAGQHREVLGTRQQVGHAVGEHYVAIDDDDRDPRGHQQQELIGLTDRYMAHG